MKNRDRKKYLAALLTVCALGVCQGCGQAEGAAKEEGRQDAGAVQQEEAAQMEDTDLPDEAGSEEPQEKETAENEESVSSENAGQPKDEAPENGRHLTAEELQEYTAWLQERSNYGFLLSEWENPEQVNLYDVFYNGAGISREGTEEEKQAFLARNGLSEINTDFYAMDKTDVSALLLDKLGLSYEELLAKGSKGLEDWYDPEADSFCTEAGDTNYISFICTDGVINEEGTIVTLYCDGDDWVRTCEVKVNVAQGHRGFLCNHITEGMALDVLDDKKDAAAEEITGTGSCLIDSNILENLHMDADASAVENDYVLGDWSLITKEALQGVWYHHPKDVGDSTEYDVVLQLGETAVVYYPAVGFYGDAYYEWDIVDRSGRGLCPELAIYFRGTKEGELAWYILGISEERDYFWCNGEVFYRQ